MLSIEPSAPVAQTDAHTRGEASGDAGDGTILHYRLIDAAASPWKYGFISLLRTIAGQHPQLPPIGRAILPRQEPFRLGQQPSLTFSPREIATVDVHAKRPQIRLFGLGMLGPNGPLPIHFTEIAKDRLDNRHDATLVDFLDTFHHRYMTHMYRAWSQAQAAAGLDRADDEQFSQYVSRLAGNDPVNIQSSPLPPHARMAASAHLVREARNPDGLATTLAHFFGVPVLIEEYVLHWISVSSDEHTLLGRASIATVMGEGALLGEVVPDRQHKFRIVIGPLSLAQYLRLTPQGCDLPLLVEWVRAFVGLEYEWEVELKVAAAAATPARIGGTEKLGWATWLGDSDATQATTGMIFEPEHYMHQDRNAKQHKKHKTYQGIERC